MEAKDLMIGDLIKTNSTSWSEDLKDKYCKVTFLAKNYVSSISVDDSQKEPYGEGSSYDPIPLTPEILEKNGWVNNVYSNESYDNEEVECLSLWVGEDGKNKWWWHSGLELVIPINYVHEFQHALRLCGIDKEIIL